MCDFRRVSVHFGGWLSGKITPKIQDQTVNDGVAHSKNPRKCAYHVTFDLEHTLDAGSPGDHRVQVWWRSGHFSARRSDLRKSLQTDGQTDGRRAIAVAHSWNELKMKLGLVKSRCMRAFR